MSLSKLCASLVRQRNLPVLATQVKYFHTNNYLCTKLAQEKKPDWNRAVSEAEKIVGYPTSFLSLRWLLSDEIANVALHLRKLVGSNHPLLKTAKNLLYNGKNNMQAWGLIVLLVSKAAGHSSDIPDLEQDKAAGVLHSQRALAEVTEMIRTSHLVHKGLVNLQPSAATDASGDMMFGNKIALLSGDYLLSNSCTELANLRNQDLVELMSSAVRDLAEAEFVGPRDKQNNPLPAKPRSDIVEYKQFTDKTLEPLVVSEALGNARAEWTLRHVLNAGSLLGKSCQGTLKLAGHPLELQEQGYLFGKHLALAWQACLDREPFLPGTNGPFSLVCAPVMFTLQDDPSLYEEIEKGQETVDDVDYETVRKAVLAGPGLDLTKKLQKEHSTAALEVLNQLPASDARTALANIIAAMQDL
ncbi:all trans-polyprenyl-diphosphate synthase PDSS2 [Tribolium castaneum]|uniref:all trans-polyprenyl-diphosphate synthase PDSS2 n=1 Tax=Tribolium castaneum TaxID=7070 RepID=UPI0000D563FD|nr:PREDICTED: decaprenyl-diphosphate synthase subunit 2 [Tribolium castaneum]XP_015836039.1 PREDICTED: decaprenyl-diphosphate synthase subunit 2 [Tribolium castaneum]XP_970126.1 PREDICTED: decaprenyl-diphosphate synthase subunit 2 [Tribolium castaneum]|eukprot:XP_008194170.1 PREDICTED: decaprenyl-diphosphate synthase subunit 2 [Tribolium castaneum]